MAKMSPCKYCGDKRHPGCHDKCPEYIEWVDELHREKEKRKEELKALYDVFRVHFR